MQKIASFQIDHNTLNPGVYISRTDDNIVTYDIRTRRPNRDEVMDTGTAHTIEHLFATMARSGKYSSHIIYFGPMGCRTGFYLITRDMNHRTAIDLIRDVFAQISVYQGEIPGAKPMECGNYSDQNLQGARAEARQMVTRLLPWDTHMLNYT